MRCVYSRNKSVSSQIKTEPITNDNQSPNERPSLIVAPIAVTSKKGKSFHDNKIKFVNNMSKSKRVTSIVQSKRLQKLKEDQINNESRMTDKQSIINFLYEDDQQLTNNKIKNSQKYQQITNKQIKSQFNKLATQGNSNSIFQQDKPSGHGLTLTKRMRNILEQTQTLPNRPSKLRVTIKRPF